MILRNIGYSEVDSKGNEWSIKNFSLGKINLIVGQNSTGKTRLLNIIGALGTYLAAEKKPNGGAYIAEFSNEIGESLTCEVQIKEREVLKEKITINDEVLLDRGSDGKGTIKAVGLDLVMDFEIAKQNLALTVKRDKIQHPFLEQYYEWGKSVRHYRFGTELGKDTFAIFVNNESLDNLDAKDNKSVVAFFKKGEAQFGEEFKNKILEDINSIGYEFTDVGIGAVENVEVISSGVTSNPDGLYVKEQSHEHIVNQTEMSQGLFRALSLFIQLRYSEYFTEHGMILVDDIGEGLDFERSTKLIESLIDISESSQTQLIMSTNDRFVMNNVPLEYWSIIRRNGGECSVMNYHNSKEKFDEFEFTGLSNFDFFSSKYYAKD